jgi:hypothetical protein
MANKWRRKDGPADGKIGRLASGPGEIWCVRCAKMPDARKITIVIASARISRQVMIGCLRPVTIGPLKIPL